MRPARRPSTPFHLGVVEGGGRLVGQQERRVVRQGAGDGDPLLLTARSSRGGASPRAEADAIQSSAARATRRGRPPRRRAAGHHVLGRRQARDEVERLEHDADGVAAERVRSLPARVEIACRRIDGPVVGERMAARQDSSVVLPLPLGPRSNTSDPGGASMPKPSRRTGHLAAAPNSTVSSLTLSSGITDLRTRRRIHDDGPTSAGQAADQPHGEGDQGQQHHGASREGDHRGNTPANTREGATASAADRAERTKASTINVPTRSVESVPKALNTAKSRERSSAET